MRTAAICTVVVLAALVTAGCDQYEHEEMSFAAAAVVTRAGLPEPGLLVSFGADKIKSGGVPVTGDRLNDDRFTDFLGVASYSFGYNLEYDSRDQRFFQGARVVAWVSENGVTYSDTAQTPVPFSWPFPPYPLDTLRIDLPPR
jgi:hypothetical protein